jgi:hypothetical protein
MLGRNGVEVCGAYARNALRVAVSPHVLPSFDLPVSEGGPERGRLGADGTGGWMVPARPPTILRSPLEGPTPNHAIESGRMGGDRIATPAPMPILRSPPRRRVEGAPWL